LLDGMNKGRIFMSIIIPLIRPALIAQFILSFNGAFNDLVGPLMYLGTNQNLYTVQLVINSLNTTYGAQIELLLSASFLALVPTFILFAVAQNYFVEGIAMSGLKG
ncbi:MAG: ABC transporter permease subunit, partial [Christensenellales bacterium]